MKALKWTGIILLALLLIGFGGFQLMKHNTKKHSPERTATLKQGDLTMTVTYCSPGKKGREIFGGLVPYGETWRTGANEATTFASDKDLRIAGQMLKAGTYTLWTVPGPDSWQVVWNRGEYPWGVNMESKASRDPALDVLVAEAPVQPTDRVVEDFTITLQEGAPMTLQLMWDQVSVSVSLERP